MDVIQLLAGAYPSETELVGNARLQRLVKSALNGTPYEKAFSKTGGSSLHFDVGVILQFLLSRMVHVLAVWGYLQDAGEFQNGEIRTRLLQTFVELTEVGRWLRSPPGEDLIMFLEKTTNVAS